MLPTIEGGCPPIGEPRGRGSYSKQSPPPAFNSAYRGQLIRHSDRVQCMIECGIIASIHEVHHALAWMALLFGVRTPALTTDR